MKRALGFLILTPIGWVLLLAAALMGVIWLSFKIVLRIYRATTN